MRLPILLAFVHVVLGTPAYPHVNAGHCLEVTRGYMELPLQRNQTPPSLRKRQSNTPIYTEDLGLAHFIDGECTPDLKSLSLTVRTVSVGSNNQTIPLMFNTGSSITWINIDR
jgi:hypothetical protein